MQPLPAWRTAVAIAAITVACVLLSLVRFTPDRAHGAGAARITPILHQLDAPFVGIEHGERSGIPNAMAWRVLPPVVGHALHLPARVYLALPLAGIGIFVFGVAWYLHASSGRLIVAATGALLVTTSSLFFVATGWVGNYDVLYVAALMLLLTSRSPLGDWALCSLGPWCDERFLLILPGIVCVRAALASDGSAALRRAAVPITLGLAPYVALRLYAINAGDLSVTYQILHQSAHYREYLPSTAYGWWMGLRFGWVPALATVWWAARKGGALPVAALLVGAALTTLLAWDVSRCASIMVPFMVVGISRDTGRALPVLALLNLALPAAHVTEGVTLYLSSLFSR